MRTLQPTHFVLIGYTASYLFCTTFPTVFSYFCSRRAFPFMFSSIACEFAFKSIMNVCDEWQSVCVRVCMRTAHEDFKLNKYQKNQTLL